MIKLCIFDLDGTTVNSLKSIAHFANETLCSFGFEPFGVDEYRYLAGGGARKLMSNLLAARGADEVLIDPMVTDWLARYENNYLHLTESYDGINEMLASLKQTGIITAIVTNKSERVANRIIDCLFGEKGKLIDEAVCEHPGMVLKPAPDELLKLGKKYGIPMKETLYVGDHHIDMVTGKNAGAICCGVTWGFHTAEELTDGGADYIASHPRDITDIVTNYQC